MLDDPAWAYIPCAVLDTTQIHSCALLDTARIHTVQLCRLQLLATECRLQCTLPECGTVQACPIDPNSVVRCHYVALWFDPDPALVCGSRTASYRLRD
jgi:hypothetical protein